MRIAAITDLEPRRTFASGDVLPKSVLGNDELTAVISPSGRRKGYAYDNRGQVATITEPNGNTINFTYDLRGNLLTVADQRGNTTTYGYDELYRVVSKRDPLGQISTITYDSNNRVTDTWIESVDGQRSHTIHWTAVRP